MQIIFVDRRLSRARTISVSKRQVLIALVGSVLGLLFLSAALNWLTLRMATELRIPLVSQALSLLVRATTSPPWRASSARCRPS